VVVAVWSVKGGVGVTSVAALVAIGQAERGQETVLVDLCGDASLVLGVDDAARNQPGVAEWSSVPLPAADALARIEIAVRPCLSLVPRGNGPHGDLGPLASALATSERQVIVDCGVIGDDGPSRVVVDAADISLLVVRECYLVLQAVKACRVTPTGVIVIREPRRGMGLADVEAVAQAPVVGRIAADSAVTSALDAGLLNARLPRRLVKTMAQVVNRAA